MATGGSHSLALCDDGTVAAWGFNAYGQLGDGTTVNRNAPVAATTVSALANRLPVTVSAGLVHSTAWCTDGTALAWGNNSCGQIGDGSTVSRSAAVVVDGSNMPPGELPVISTAGCSSEHTLFLVSSYPAPVPELVVEFPVDTVIAAGTVAG